MSNQADIIAIKINVNEIDKSRLFEGRGGKKWLDLIMIPSPNSQYDDSHFVTQSCSKEEREQGKRMPIIGNAKVLKSGSASPQRRQEPTERQMANQSDDDLDSDVPF